MMLTRTLIATLLVVTFSLFGSGAFAAPIAIVNAGFEDVVLPTDLGGLYYKVGDPPGWTSYQPGTGGATNPDFGTYRPNNLIYNVLAPEPNNVAYIDLRLGTGDPCETCPLYDGNYPDGTYPVGFEQTLSSTISANSRYDLSVEVGNPKSGDGLDFTGFGGYRIELLVGGNVIAEDNNTKAIGEGDFVTASLSFVTGSSLPPSLFLKALGIRLIHKSTQRAPDPILNWFSGIAFDDVQLSVSPVPVPAAVWLFGTALLGFIGVSRRRKVA